MNVSTQSVHDDIIDTSEDDNYIRETLMNPFDKIDLGFKMVPPNLDTTEMR